MKYSILVLTIAAALGGCTGLPPSQAIGPDVKCQTGRNEIYMTAENCNALGGFVIPRAVVRD